MPSLQLYRLGFSGYLILDFNRQIIFLIAVCLIFKFGVKKLYTLNEEEIKLGNKKWLSFAYFFTFETIVKMHESIFGMSLYSLLMQFSCINFHNTLGILSFLLALAVCTYLMLIIHKVWTILNNPNIKVSWISEHFAPLVARQGLMYRS